MKTFIIIDKISSLEDGRILIQAQNQEEALDIAIEKYFFYIPSTLEKIYGRIVDGGFFYHFFRDDISHYFEYEDGQRIDLLQRFCGNNKKIEEYFENCFYNNCRKFFGENEFFAKLYFNYFNDREKNEDNTKFPDDMVFYMIKNEPNRWDIKEVKYTD